MGYFNLRNTGSIFLIASFVAFFSMTSCNNNSSAKKDEKDTTQKKEEPIAPAAKTFTLHRYKLTKSQLDTLLKDNYAKEIRFSFFELSKNEYGLKAVAEDGNKNENSEEVKLSVVPNSDTLFSDNANRNDQYLTRGALKGVWGLAGERGKPTRINPSKYSDIILVPVGKLEPKSQSVMFAVFVDGVQILITAGSTYTNPSPPAKPCEEYEGCDL